MGNRDQEKRDEDEAVDRLAFVLENCAWPVYLQLEVVTTINFKTGSTQSVPAMRVLEYQETAGGRPKAPKPVTAWMTVDPKDGFDVLLDMVKAAVPSC